MSVTTTMRAIVPKAMNIDAIAKEIFTELGKEGKDDQRLLDQTTSGFTGTRPTFESDIYRGDDVGVRTTPGGDGEGVKKWRYLNEGTRVRHAVMSKGYRAGTTPGQLRSSRKRGRTVFVSRKIRRPGIAARGWTTVAQKERTAPFQGRIVKAIGRGANNLF